MARIRGFSERRTDPRPHPTEVDAAWTIFEAEGETYLQISTFGSEGRQDHGTVSQTIQLDARRAGELAKILSRLA